MKIGFLLSLLALSMVGLSGCISHQLDVGHVADVQAIDFANTRFKKGTSCANYLFPGLLGGIPLGGEDRFLNAVQNGRISRVKFTERRRTSFIIFGQQCIDVYGQ